MYPRPAPPERGIENIHGLSAPSTINHSLNHSLWFGFLGQHFLISLHLTLGEEATSPALRELYLRSEHYGDRSTEEQIYRTFLKHTPSGLEEEFRDLYRRLHGGPFIDAED